MQTEVNSECWHYGWLSPIYFPVIPKFSYIYKKHLQQKTNICSFNQSQLKSCSCHSEEECTEAYSLHEQTKNYFVCSLTKVSFNNKSWDSSNSNFSSVKKLKRFFKCNYIPLWQPRSKALFMYPIQGNRSIYGLVQGNAPFPNVTFSIKDHIF